MPSALESPKKIRDKKILSCYNIFDVNARLESTFSHKGLFTSGQLPNSLGAPQVVRTPATLQHCHSTGMTALVSIVSQYAFDV